MDKEGLHLIHITVPSNYDSIKEKGIIPTRRLTRQIGELSKRAAYFILSSDIEKWLKWRGFLRWLIYHVSKGGKESRLSLLIIPLSELPKIPLFVVDRFPFQITQIKESPFYRISKLRMLYPYSLTPLSLYLEDKRLRNAFQLPEVVSFTRVPLPDNHLYKEVDTERALQLLRRLHLRGK